jgi:hypothetical protein
MIPLELGSCWTFVEIVVQENVGIPQYRVKFSKNGTRPVTVQWLFFCLICRHLFGHAQQLAALALS